MKRYGTIAPAIIAEAKTGKHRTVLSLSNAVGCHPQYAYRVVNDNIEAFTAIHKAKKSWREKR